MTARDALAETDQFRDIARVISATTPTATFADKMQCGATASVTKRLRPEPDEPSDRKGSKADRRLAPAPH